MVLRLCKYGNNPSMMRRLQELPFVDPQVPLQDTIIRKVTGDSPMLRSAEFDPWADSSLVPSFGFSGLLGECFQEDKASPDAFIRQAVQKAIQEAIAGFDLSSLLNGAAPTAPVATSPPAGAKLRKAAARLTRAAGSQAPSTASPDPTLDGGAKAKGKGPKPGRDKPKGAGKGKGDQPGSSHSGKGKGAAAAQPDPSAATRVVTISDRKPSKAEEGWHTVQRKPKSPAAADPWRLRKGDWDSPVIVFDDVAARLAAHTEGAFKAVVLCDDSQYELLCNIAKGSNKEHGITAVTLAKDGNRCAGECDGQLRFRNVSFRCIRTAGQEHPKPRVSSPAVGIIKAETTTVLFARFHKKYMEPAAWAAACKAPQAEMHMWAAKRNLKLHDSFSWSKERRPGDTSEVQLPKEPPLQYLSRVRATGSEFGIVVGLRSLGKRQKRDPAAPVARTWLLEHAPLHWTAQQAQEALATTFSEVTMVKQRRNRSGSAFYFRGAHVTDHDMVALPITVEDSQQIVLWARWAPVQHKVQRQFISGQGSWSLRQPKDPFTTAESVPLEPKGGTPAKEPDSIDVEEEDAAKTDSGKTTKPQSSAQPAKRPCQSQRAIPDTLVAEAIPQDGNCLFGAVSAGLAFTTGKDAIHPSMLRARVKQHYQKHRQVYEEQWQGELPNATPSSDFDAYLEAIGTEGQWGSSLEIRALARLLDVRIVVYPRQFHFNVSAVHRQQRKHVFVLLHNGYHFDLLKPAKDQKWPREIMDVIEDLPPTFKGGGSSSEAGTVWTKPSALASARTVWTHPGGAAPSARTKSAARSAKAPPASVWTQVAPAAVQSAPSQASEPPLQDAALEEMVQACTDPPKRPRGRIAKCQWLQGGFARCRLCPFKSRAQSAQEAQNVLGQHFKTHHRGETPAGGTPFNKQQPSLVTELSEHHDFVWKCRFCNFGVTLEAASTACEERITRDKDLHKQTAHPKLSWKEWRRAGRDASTLAATKTRFAKTAQKYPPLPGFQTFRWPRFGGKKCDRLIRWRFSWICTKCHAPFSVLKEALAHDSHCPSPYGRSRAKERLNAVRQVRKTYLKSAPAPGELRWRSGLPRQRPSFSTATINVCRRRVSMHDQVEAFLKDHCIDIAVLPEADVNEASGLSFCNAWRAKGLHAALSRPEAGVSKVAVVSSFPFKQVTLTSGEAETRHAAILVDLKGPCNEVVTLMVIGAYLQSGDEPTAAGQAMDLAQMAVHSGFKFLLLGDFNLEQEHPVIRDCVLTGIVRRCDDCHPGVLPPTGPIFRSPAPPRSSTTPLSPPQPAEALEKKGELYDDAAFQTACQTGDLDEAWRLLSDWGEDLLCDPDPIAVPRSAAWTPAVPAAPRTGKCAERSAGLRALLKLLSRLRMAAAKPHDLPLWRRLAISLGNVRRLVPELPPIGKTDDATVAAVAALVQTYSEQEREAARRVWKRATRDSLAASRAYVKRKADQILEWDKTAAEDRAPTSGRHPAVEVDRQAAEWKQKWRTRCSDSGPCSQVARILESVPRPPPSQVDFQICAGSLRTSLSSMQHKSCGPDAWTASALLQLPSRWWRCAAQLWGCVLQHSLVPERWLCGRTALLWKPAGGTRPISILPFIWRCGAKLLNQQLETWTSSWRCHFDSGGIAGTSIDTALQQLSLELHSGAQMAVQQDVSSFFDSLEHGLTAQLLRHLRAPESLVSLFENYCARSSRLFALQGALGNGWVRPERGLPQGCPLSPDDVAAASVTGHAYVDDRSAAFDTAFKLGLSLTKCAVVAAPSNASAALLAKVLLRLRLMRGLDLRLHSARHLIRSLVVPCFAWAAPYANPDPKELEAIRKEVLLHLCSRQVGQEAARVLFYEIAGWYLEPRFALDAAILRALWRHVVRPPSWQEALPLSAAPVSPLNILPCLPEVLDRLQWQLTANASRLLCPGPSGEPRHVCIGFESFSVVLRWLTEAYRMKYVLKTGRVWQRKVRDPGSAVGIDCPPPPRTAHYEFGGHKAVFQEARGDRNLALASFGAGCTNWFFNAKGNFAPEHQRHKCMCGGSHPSRPHLVWSCSHTASIRQGIAVPQDRAAERLFAQPVPPMPSAPQAVDTPGFIAELVEQLVPRLSQSVMMAATDGSSKHEVGAMGFALGSTRAALATGDANEDQTSFRMELRAVYLLLVALQEAVRQTRAAQAFSCRRLWLAIDCESVILAVKGCRGTDYFLLLEQIRQALKELSRQDLQVTMVWTPSHGKKPRWQPPHGLNGDTLRELNAAADAAAGACMERRLRNSAREQWAQLRQQAMQWEVRTLRAVAATASAYHSYLKTVGHGPRDDFPLRAEP
ncbi:unnamed protein product [Symbiodinium sp. CCMP2592]|nr:unnamed protein product [Symbiodinium sp. CCMP2592]